MSNRIFQCYRYNESNKIGMDKLDSGSVLTSDEDVGSSEERAQPHDLTASVAVASETDQQPQPSGSSEMVPSSPGVSVKTHQSTTEDETDAESPQVLSKRTSTPKKKIPERRARAPRLKRRRARVLKKQTKQLAEVVLD